MELYHYHYKLNVRVTSRVIKRLRKWENFSKITKLSAHIIPCRNKNLASALENWIKLVVKLSMKDRTHFSNSFTSLKVFCEGL